MQRLAGAWDNALKTQAAILSEEDQITSGGNLEKSRPKNTGFTPADDRWVPFFSNAEGNIGPVNIFQENQLEKKRDLCGLFCPPAGREAVLGAVTALTFLVHGSHE